MNTRTRRAQIITPKDGRAFCSGQVCDNIDRVMAQIRLVCWREELAAERARALKKAGLEVDASPFHPGGMITQLKENPPAVMLIDLDRLPSHGREVAVMLRSSKSMRHLTI